MSVSVLGKGGTSMVAVLDTLIKSDIEYAVSWQILNLVKNRRNKMQVVRIIAIVTILIQNAIGFHTACH
jgi:hypothetical protein